MQAVILAGGASRRLGGVPKAGLVLGGQTLLARTVDAAAQLLAAERILSAEPSPPPQPVMASQSATASRSSRARIAVVGPGENISRWLAGSQSGPDVVVVQEDPPFSGPAAGVAAGVAALAGDGGYVLVLACDMPHASKVARLLVTELARCAAGEGVMAVADGKKQPLAAIYPLAGLREAVDAARAAHRLENASVFSLVASVNTKECAVPSGLTADIDTWADARAQGIGAGPTDAEGQHGQSRGSLAGMDQEASGGL